MNLLNHFYTVLTGRPRRNLKVNEYFKVAILLSHEEHITERVCIAISKSRVGVFQQYPLLEC